MSGRRVHRREVGALGPGSHRIELRADRALAPGLYLMGLRHGSGERTAKVAVLR